jgi:hypothetical protein
MEIQEVKKNFGIHTFTGDGKPEDFWDLIAHS